MHQTKWTLPHVLLRVLISEPSRGGLAPPGVSRGGSRGLPEAPRGPQTQRFLMFGGPGRAFIRSLCEASCGAPKGSFRGRMEILWQISDLLGLAIQLGKVLQLLVFFRGSFVAHLGADFRPCSGDVSRIFRFVQINDRIKGPTRLDKSAGAWEFLPPSVSRFMSCTRLTNIFTFLLSRFQTCHVSIEILTFLRMPSV